MNLGRPNRPRRGSQSTDKTRSPNSNSGPADKHTDPPNYSIVRPDHCIRTHPWLYWSCKCPDSFPLVRMPRSHLSSSSLGRMYTLTTLGKHFVIDTPSSQYTRTRMCSFGSGVLFWRIGSYTRRNSILKSSKLIIGRLKKTNRINLTVTTITDRLDGSQ